MKKIVISIVALLLASSALFAILDATGVLDDVYADILPPGVVYEKEGVENG